MTDTVTLALPDETLRRYQRGANAARKPLEEFLVERLVEATPPLPADLPTSLNEELITLEALEDDALWQIALSHLSTNDQQLYSTLLDKNSDGTITAIETEMLQSLGAKARQLTLKKAHAFMLLKWRGYDLPNPDMLPDSE